MALAGLLSAQTAPITPHEAHRRAEALLKQMTVDEKVGQSNQASGIVKPDLDNDKPDDLIPQSKVGSVLWLIDVKEINRLQHLRWRSLDYPGHGWGRIPAKCAFSQFTHIEIYSGEVRQGKSYRVFTPQEEYCQARIDSICITAGKRVALSGDSGHLPPTARFAMTYMGSWNCSGVG